MHLLSTSGDERLLESRAWRRTIQAGRRLRGARTPRRADLAVFHEFAPAPAGGANQTLRAILGEMQRRGVRVEVGRISRSTQACLFNSFNFDFARLERHARRTNVRMVHRVGAVTSLYRGFDDGTDRRVGEINAKLADATIAISNATIEMYEQIGIELVEPRVVYNGCEPCVFHPRGRVAFRRNRKVRLISSSWSDNPRKGTPVYRWLEDHLDWERYEFTFVGNSAVAFSRIRHVPPIGSNELADLLRGHDVFITATENDAYSNAVVEALSCGLPVIYLDSGGTHEAVRDAGLAFREREQIPALLEQLVDEYEQRQAAIALPTLEEIVDGYLDVLGLDRFVGQRAVDGC